MPRSISWASLVVVLVLVYSSTSLVSADDEPKFKCPTNSPYFYPCTCEGGGDEGIFIRCENTNLASIALGLANIRLPIETLTFHKCAIKTLKGSVFRALVVKELVIEDTPISEIHEDVFKGVATSIKHLEFQNLPLSGLPTKAIAPLRKLEVLTVVGANITKLVANSIPPLPKLKEVTIRDCGLESIHAQVFTRHRSLAKLSFPYNNLTSLPRGLFRGKRDVKFLDLAHNKFKKLDAQYFQDLNQMTWCNMSHNAITNFGRNPFARNTVLGWLSLANNQIKKIEPNDFRSMRFMRRLYLNDNEITSVGRGAFNKMRRIGTIDLARNKLTTVARGMFADMQYIEFIDIAENKINKIEKNGFKDIFLTHINISHNQLETIDDGAFVNTLNITVLDLSYNKLKAMPEEVFPGENSYMTELKLQFNNLTSMGNVSLHFPGIKILNVTYNQLVEIPRRTFGKLYELHTIDFSHNKIKTIERGNGINQLFSLRQIDLSYNELEKLSHSVFGTVPTLLHLNISHNNISDVSKSVFVNLVSLRFLHLNHNRINEIFQLPQSLNYLNLQNNNISYIEPGSTWPVMNALLGLNLDNNHLGDSMGSGTFRNLNSLRELGLNNNSITIPPWQAFTEMQTLQYLNLDHNKITNITRGAFGRLPVVFRLNLAHNGVSNISKLAFDGLLQLLTLNLSNNALHTIPNEAFRGCVSMQTIDLSNNFLNKIDNGTNGLFDDLLSIRHINVSHNEFGTVSKKMFPYHQWIPYNLQTVDLSYNHMPVLHKNLLIGMQKLKKLNVSNNFLNEIRPNVIGNLTKLEVLDLSHNELEAVGNGVFGRGMSLREVYLRNNTLISVPAQVLMANENLTVLDLRDNNIHEYYSEFVPRAINGSSIMYNGNPVGCDCELRRIRSWLDTWLGSKSWGDVECAAPQHLVGRMLPQITEEELRCSDSRRSLEEYQVNPDVKFRLFDEDDVMERLDVSWYVTTREDIGGFVADVYNTTSGKLVAKQPLLYTARRQVFPEVKRGRYRVCVGAVTSDNITRALQPAQCHGFFVSHAHTSLATPFLLLLPALVLALATCWT